MLYEFVNNDEQEVSAGFYAVKTTGALTIQWELNNEGFNTMTDGVISGESSQSLWLPKCNIKVIDATDKVLMLKTINQSSIG